MSVRIILADDHTIVRHGLARAFQQENDVQVVAQADNGRTAVELACELNPDLVVMDIGMPELNGIEATRLIREKCYKTKIVALSMHSNRKYVTEMFKAGASGYLLKNCSFEELVKAVHTVNEGKTYISPSISDVVVENYLTGAPPQECSAFSLLTEREREVVQLLAEGKTTKTVARRLNISPKTVEAHRLRIMDKLNMDSIAQLTKYAIQEGLTLPEP